VDVAEVGGDVREQADREQPRLVDVVDGFDVGAVRFERAA
jgi:hypothetical protein